MTSNPTDKRRLIVVGAGPMGLAAAYFAALKGYKVDVLEAAPEIGGMAVQFDFDGLSIERFYHFCALSDSDTMELLDEVGIGDAMRWKRTTMGYCIDGQLHPWGDPIALLKFPHMNIVEKVRYGLQAFLSTKRSDWRKLDQISAESWFRSWCGDRVYDLMWRPLLEYKFYEYAGDISAAWMWQRIKRLGNSRSSLFEERLGYIEGGTQTLMDALAQAIISNGGTIHTSKPVRLFDIDETGAVAGVHTADGEHFSADDVVSTAPLPAVVDMLPKDDALRRPYVQMQNISCVCVLLKLKRSVSPHFWVNLNMPGLEVPGLVEFSNLRPLDDHIVYVPFYMPSTNPKFIRDDDSFLRESLEAIQSVNPDLTAEDIVASHIGRLKYSQPICDVGFAGKIPHFQTPIPGLKIADTSYYYPEDRGVSESIRFARLMVDALADGAPS
ncbi:MAG: NAD(P)/FAD-dependent oxidoreductase [Pseudomonadota bacterium]